MIRLPDALAAGIHDRASLEHAIRQFLSVCGAVERIQLLKDPHGSDTHIGCLVDMGTPAEAMRAQSELGVTVFGFRTLVFSLERPAGLGEGFIP